MQGRSWVSPSGSSAWNNRPRIREEAEMGGFGSGRVMRKACFVAALLAFSAAGVVTPVPAVAEADSTVSSCNDATLRAAIEAGGVVTFTVNCPSILLTTPFDIPAGLNVDLEANG